MFYTPLKTVFQRPLPTTPRRAATEELLLTGLLTLTDTKPLIPETPSPPPMEDKTPLSLEPPQEEQPLTPLMLPESTQLELPLPMLIAPTQRV